VATRWYFPATASNTTGLTPSFDAGWQTNSEAARAELATTKGSSAITAGTQIGPWTATAGQSALDRQWIGPRLGAQTISGTFSLMLMVREFAGTDNVDQIHTGLFVVNSSGTKVHTLKAKGNSGTTLEFVNNATHRSHTAANAVALTSYTCAAGDRIVVEIGYANSTAGTTPEASAKWGENATDATLGNNATTTDVAGWIEFSANLTLEPRTGTLAKTLDDATATAVGTAPVVGAGSATLDAATLTSDGTVADAGASGELAATLGDVTASGAGLAYVAGAAAKTLDDATSSGAGIVPVVGSSSPTLSAVTTSSAGGVSVVGSGSGTLSDVTASSAGVAPVVGVSAKTLGDVTSSGAGVVPIVGAGSATLGAVTLTANDGPGTTSGTLDATLGALTASAAGVVPIVGTCAPSLSDMASSAAGVCPVVGAAVPALRDATCASQGLVDVDGDGSRVFDDVVSASMGRADVQGFVTATLQDLTNTPETPLVGQFSATLAALVVSSQAIKIRVPLSMPDADVRILDRDWPS
jgi:hypothetical protein